MVPILAALGLSKSFPRHGGVITVLESCDFELQAGEAVAITGPSGSGKSTLLNILGGLDNPTQGSVAFAGQQLDFADHADLALWRTNVVGFVFQFHFLLPDFTTIENLLIPVRACRQLTAEDEQRALGLLERMGLADRRDHLPGELSGGEQQRVAVARAFMNKPKIVLADEPFGNLDRSIGGKLGDLLFELRETDGTSLVIVTHDLDLASRSDRRLTLKDGALVAGDQSEGVRS